MSRFQDFLDTITWWDDPHPLELSADKRAIVAEEAARWFEVLKEAGLREKIQFHVWVRRSRHHMTAYEDTARIDARLKTVSPAPSSAPETADLWGNINKHPIVVVVAAVVATACAVWGISENIRVRPATQQIERLEKRVETLESQLAATIAAQKTH